MPAPTITHASALGLRSEQQDRFVATQLTTGYLLAVMDGHGGSRTAEILATHLSASFQLALNSLSDPQEALRAMIQRLAQRTSIETSGSTLSVVYIPGDFSLAHVAIIGDSPVVIADSKNQWHISPMHNARSNSKERAAAIARGARYAEGYLEDPQVPGHGLQMSRALGDRVLSRILDREPDVYSVPLGTHSLVILTSDGVLDSFESEIETQLTRVGELAKSGQDANALVQDALDRQTEDNVSVIIWKA